MELICALMQILSRDNYSALKNKFLSKVIKN